MNAMTTADTPNIQAHQEAILKQKTKKQLIAYIGKMEAELTASREKRADLLEFTQHQAHQIENLKTNEELRETAIQGLKDEIEVLANCDQVGDLKQIITEGMGQKEFEAWLMNPQERRGEFFQNLQKQVDDKTKKIAYVEGKLAINSDLLKDVKQETEYLRNEVGHWRDQVSDPNPLDFPLKQQLDEEISGLRQQLALQGKEYDLNKERNQKWYDEMMAEVDVRKKHHEGFQKLLKIVHEADPYTGMW
jgi:hypothetical protein